MQCIQLSLNQISNHASFLKYHSLLYQRSMNPSTIYLLALLLSATSIPLMIEQKEQFFQRIKTKNIALFFYGETNSQEFHVYQQTIPTTNHLYSSIEFLYIPSTKFKLNRPSPSLSIFRNIGSGDWVLYHGAFRKDDIDRWIRRHIFQQLPLLTIEELDSIFTQHRRAFILLDWGEFQIIRTKTYLQQFCQYHSLSCYKLTSSSPLLNIGMKLLGLSQGERGISKLAYYNPISDRLELYSKDVWFIRREEILEMYQGQAGIIAVDGVDYNGLEIELHYEDRRDQENL